MSHTDPASAPPPALGTAHWRRLRALWRSAGWPCHDLLELDLLVAGLLHRQTDSAGRDTLRLTDAGLQALAAHTQRNRRARDPHEALVERVALEMHRAGRLVWRGLSLRAAVEDPVQNTGTSFSQVADKVENLVGNAVTKSVTVCAPGAGDNTLSKPGVENQDNPVHRPTGVAVQTALFTPLDKPVEGVWADSRNAAGPLDLPTATNAPTTHPPASRWVVAMPDVYSVRQTSVENYLLPICHEVKVRRADLLADLKRPAKGQAYRALASECWYVLRAGIGRPEEIPPEFGVLVAHPWTAAEPLDASADLPDGCSGYGRLEVLRPAPRRAFKPDFALWMALAQATPERFDLPAEQSGLGEAR